MGRGIREGEGYKGKGGKWGRGKVRERVGKGEGRRKSAGRGSGGMQ